MTSRRADIDLIRGFAMLMIVVTHVAVKTLPYAVSGPLGLLLGSAALFFMTSGALNLPVKASPGEFYRRRIVRLGVMFVLWSVLYAVLYHTWGWLDADPQRSLFEELKWLIVTPTWGPGWFVYVLIGIYLVMPLVTPWLEKATARQLNWLIAAWMASGLLPLVALHTPVDVLGTVLTPFTGFLGYAVAGYWLIRNPLRIRYALLFLGLGLIFGAKFYVTGLRYGWEATMTDDLSINIMAVNIGIFALCMAWRRVPSVVLAPFRLTSRYSLGIFLSHWLIIDAVVVPLGLGFWLGTLVSLAASLLLARLMEVRF